MRNPKPKRLPSLASSSLANPKHVIAEREFIINYCVLGHLGIFSKIDPTPLVAAGTPAPLQGKKSKTLRHSGFPGDHSTQY